VEGKVNRGSLLRDSRWWPGTWRFSEFCKLTCVFLAWFVIHILMKEGGGFVVVEGVHEFQLRIGDEAVQREYFLWHEEWCGVGIEGRFCDDTDGLFLFEEQLVEGGFCGTPVDGGAVGEVGMYKGVI